jgi:hypothetical protein
MAYKKVPNESFILYNPVSKIYMVSRSIMRNGIKDNQYQGGITSLTKAKQIRDKFVKELPPETAAQTNRRTKTFSGKEDPKELNKASRFFYKRGEISSPNYSELNTKQKDKILQNVSRGATPGKFSVNTQYTPLKTPVQNKILKQFPDADFTIYKYGFNDAVDRPTFDAVKSFIKRGYKPAFYNVKSLPEKTQNIIVEAFGKEADEAGTPIRFGPGRKFGISGKENAVLNQRITNFIRDTGQQYPFAFSFEKSENWIIAQMARAAKNNPTVYKVFRNEAGKIIAASENGIKYYHANSKIGNPVTNHPEAKKISKFVEVARNAKASIPQALAKAFPKGFDRTLLRNDRAYTDLLQWLDNSEGRRRVQNAIEVHHAGAGGVRSNPALAKDLQLLTRLDNLAAANIQKVIEKDLDAGRNPFTSKGSRISELKEKGIRLNVGGKEYGAGFETAEKGLKRIEKQAATKLAERLKTDPKLSGFSKFLQQDVIGFGTAAKENALANGDICDLVKNKATGGPVLTCVEAVDDALEKNPKKLAQEINKSNAGGAFNKLKNSSTKFLTALKDNPNLLRGGLPGKIALGLGTVAAGVGAGALVKQFRNDDPSTYLTNDSQMEGMIISDVEQKGKEVDDNILLDNQFKLELAGAAGLTAPIAGQVYKTARAGTPPLLESPLEFDQELKTLKRTIRQITHPGGKKAKRISEAGQQVIRNSRIRINELNETIQAAKVGKEGSGVFRSAFGLEKGVLGKGLWALGAPIVQVPSTLGYIAQDVREGKDVGEIATNPLNYLGAAFMNPAVKALGKAGMSRGLLGIASLGLAGTAALPAISIGAGLATLGTLGYQGYKLFTGRDRSDEDFFR